MSTKYVTEDNLNDILAGIGGKFLNIDNRVNRVKMDLLNSPATLTVGSWGSVSLNKEMTDFDEVEFEYKVIFGSNTQFRKFSVLKSSLLAMTSAGRCMDSFEMDAGVTSNTIDQYIGIIMKISSSDYKNPEFYTKFGGLLSSAYIELVSVRGINYSQSYGDTPIGTIISYMGLTPPEEYLACDGTTYNITDYWELADFIKNQFGSYNYFGGDGTTTFKVPDLRGEFLRGTGTNSHTNQGSGASVGTHQNATILNDIWKFNNNLYFTRTMTNRQTNVDSFIASGGSRTFVSGSANENDSNPYTMITARPTNTSVLYCIKYTNSLIMQPSNNYSTTEKRIGTWIDGKPLYQKTYSATSPSAVNTSADIVTLDSNMSVKEISGILDSPTVLMLNHYVSSTDFATIWKTSVTGNIRMSVGSTSYTSKPVYVTIKYTKS